jgi:hypothetical protein
METVYHNVSISMKPVKTFLFGQGEMMGRAHDIEVYYVRRDMFNLNRFLRVLISEAIPHWHPHHKKQQELTDFCCFLLNLEEWDEGTRKKEYEILKGKLDPTHELGRFIAEKAKYYAKV